MAKTQFTEKKQRLSPKRLMAAIAALIISFLLLTSVITVAQKYFAIKRHIRELALEQQALEQKHTSLSKINDYIATSEGAEQILREKYNVVKPGEGLIVIVDSGSDLPVEESSTVSRWWRALLEGIGIHRD